MHHDPFRAGIAQNEGLSTAKGHSTSAEKFIKPALTRQHKCYIQYWSPIPCKVLLSTCSFYPWSPLPLFNTWIKHHLNSVSSSCLLELWNKSTHIPQAIQAAKTNFRNTDVGLHGGDFSLLWGSFSVTEKPTKNIILFNLSRILLICLSSSVCGRGSLRWTVQPYVPYFRIYLMKFSIVQNVGVVLYKNYTTTCFISQNIHEKLQYWAKRRSCIV